MTTCEAKCEKARPVTESVIRVFQEGIDDRLREVEQQMLRVAVLVKEIEERQDVIRQLLAVDEG